MAYGLRMWNNGFIHIDSMTRLGRVLGIRVITGAGSLTDPGFATGEAYYIPLPLNGMATVGTPSFSFDPASNTLAWSNIDTAGYALNHMLVYGVR